MQSKLLGIPHYRLQVHDQGVPGVGRAAEGLQLALPLLGVGEHLPAPRHPPVAGVLPL